MTPSDLNIKVLYVCPTAHWAGHYSLMLDRESRLLQQAGFKTGICTFKGTISPDTGSDVPHYKTVTKFWGFPLKIFSSIENTARPLKAAAWLIETYSTLCLASRLLNRGKYDVIFLRDIDPFIFLPFCLGYFCRNQKWVYTLIGYPLLRQPGTLFYKFSRASFWKRIYRRSMDRNRYTGICENREIKEIFESDFLDGILKNNLHVLHGAVEQAGSTITREEARSRLELPQDKTILLHFGFLHPGKDFRTVLSAADRLRDVIILQAGAASIETKHDLPVSNGAWKNKVILHNRFIPEEEKPLYFAAADAILLAYKKDFIQSASMLWEAAKYNLPVIASDTGYLGEMLKNYGNGLLYEPENPRSLAEAADRFRALSENQKELLKQNHTKFLDDYSADNWAESCKTLIKDLFTADHK